MQNNSSFFIILKENSINDSNLLLKYQNRNKLSALHLNTYANTYVYIRKLFISV